MLFRAQVVTGRHRVKPHGPADWHSAPMMRGVFLLFTCHFLAKAETTCAAGHDLGTTGSRALELDEDQWLEMLQVRASKDSAEKSEEDWVLPLHLVTSLGLRSDH